MLIPKLILYTFFLAENIPVRDYQLSITRTALFSNTLVALPTGLGKTLIAAVVMYNYFRWFPEGDDFCLYFYDSLFALYSNVVSICPILAGINL